MKRIMKRLVSMVAAWTIAMSCWGQYVDPIQFPTADLYDSGVMNSYARALTGTASIRHRNYEQYVEWTLEAWDNEEWSKMVRYVNCALSTGYWVPDLYYLRGLAYEKMGYMKEAKKDFKKGKREGSTHAAEALDALLQRERASKKK